jgi:hypothetical protein
MKSAPDSGNPAYRKLSRDNNWPNRTGPASAPRAETSSQAAPGSGTTEMAGAAPSRSRPLILEPV